MEILRKNRYIMDDKKDILLVTLLDFFLSFINRKKKHISIDEVRNILIIKPCHMGDVLMLTSIFPLLRKRFPEANIDIVIGEWSTALLKNNPYIRNRFIVNQFLANMNRKQKLQISKLTEFVMTYIKSLIAVRKNNYDLCLNMRKYKGNLMTFLWLSKSKFKIGYGTSGFGPFLDIEIKWVPGLHEVEYFLACLEPLGIKSSLSVLSYQLFYEQIDDEYVNEIIKEYYLDNYIVIHPCSGDTSRMQPSKTWAKIIESLDDGQIVICGTKDEINVFHEIKRLCRRDVFNLMGKFTVQQLYLFYKKAKIIYSVESLSSHIAAMTGNKVISFYKNDPIQWGPIGKNVEVVKDSDVYLNSIHNKRFNET